MSRRSDEETARRAREVTNRAIRRLDILEWVILLGAVVVALVGGGVVAVVASGAFGWEVRSTWAVASLLLFGVPGAVALRRMRKEDEASRRRLEGGPGHGTTPGERDGHHG